MLDAIIIGKVIQRIREQKGISQEVLSGFADIGRTHLSMLERGLRKPTLDTLFKISNALNVKASEIVKEIEIEMMKNKGLTQNQPRI
jgi:transcriptional regulator with XRE-family HTH domain